MSTPDAPSGGLRVAFSEDQLELAEATRSVLADLCTPAVVRQAWDGPVPELEEALAELGLVALGVPEELGGLGMGALDMVLVYEALGQYCVPGAVAEAMILAPVLAAAGEEEFVEELLDAGATVALFRAGEPCAHGEEATRVYSVSADTISCHEDAEHTSLQSVDESRKLVRVEGEGEALPGDAAAVHDHMVLATAAQLLGLSRKMLDLAVDYAKVREQFGKPIGAQQAIQHHLANALLAIRFTAPLVYQAAWSVHHDATWRRLHVAMAKAKASETAELVGRIALQVHGAIGYTTEYDLHLWLKRAWALSRAWGSTREHLDTIAASLLADPPQAPLDGIDLGVPRD